MGCGVEKVAHPHVEIDFIFACASFFERNFLLTMSDKVLTDQPSKNAWKTARFGV
jgi:hypothetical protein